MLNEGKLNITKNVANKYELELGYLVGNGWLIFIMHFSS